MGLYIDSSPQGHYIFYNGILFFFVPTKEMKGTGKLTIPGLCMLKLQNKPATKAGKKEVFGKVVMVKAKPASKVVKAYCVAALKKSI